MARRQEKIYTRMLDDGSMISPKDLSEVLPLSEEFKCMWGGEYIVFCSDRGIIYPLRGSTSLLGRLVDINPYTCEEFCACLEQSMCTKLVMSCQGDVPENFFGELTILSYPDFSQTITDLENKGLVTTFQSQNILREDDRRFSLHPRCEEIISGIEKYMGESFEVDSLGTNFWIDLTNYINMLWGSQFKVVENNINNLENGASE